MIIFTIDTFSELNREVRLYKVIVIVYINCTWIFTIKAVHQFGCTALYANSQGIDHEDSSFFAQNGKSFRSITESLM